jgi:hypothetical protein
MYQLKSVIAMITSFDKKQKMDCGIEKGSRFISSSVDVGGTTKLKVKGAIEGKNIIIAIILVESDNYINVQLTNDIQFS